MSVLCWMKFRKAHPLEGNDYRLRKSESNEVDFPSPFPQTSRMTALRTLYGTKSYEKLQLEEDLVDQLNGLKKIFTAEQIEFKSKIGGLGAVGKLKVPGKNGFKKVLLEAVQPDEKSSFLQESLNMVNLCHENVMHLIGVMMPAYSRPHLILPYMEKGDLLSYVQKESEVSFRRLIKFTLEVAEGMKYLEDKGYVHQDLCARNCLLDAKLNLRITGFGLLRSSFGKKVNMSTCKRSLRWMAPETLKSLDKEALFTSKSDVWAYGVTSWEILSRGLVPYVDVDDIDLEAVLEDGVQLERPPSCPKVIYSLWQKCWSLDPEKRPPFTAIVHEISSDGGLLVPIRNLIGFDDDLLDGLCESLSGKLFSHKDLKLKKHPIGFGSFGIVLRATLLVPDQHSRKVALKTCKIYDADPNSFLKEAVTMTDFQHPNVMSLIGLFFSVRDLPYLILPYMKNGSLSDYLKKKSPNLGISKLVNFSLEIALGMEYLANRNFVHRDLAARNCMLKDDLTVCVADFGLTRDIYEKGYYRERPGGSHPTRWMAPESLKNLVYNTKTDVWSYSITLWEIFSGGEVPYNNIEHRRISSFVYNGQRLGKPEVCPNGIFNLMQRCWSQSPDDRPTFAQIVEQIRDFKSSDEANGHSVNATLNLRTQNEASKEPTDHLYYNSHLSLPK